MTTKDRDAKIQQMKWDQVQFSCTNKIVKIHILKYLTNKYIVRRQMSSKIKPLHSMFCSFEENKYIPRIFESDILHKL